MNQVTFSLKQFPLIIFSSPLLGTFSVLAHSTKPHKNEVSILLPQVYALVSILMLDNMD